MLVDGGICGEEVHLFLTLLVPFDFLDEEGCVEDTVCTKGSVRQSLTTVFENET